MAQETDATDTTDTTADETTPEAAEETKSERTPYIVVLMPAEMKDAVKKYADEHDTTPTALARKALADVVGFPLSDEAVRGSRSTYTSDEERKNAHKLASKKSGLIRKALFQAHMATLKGKPALAEVANNAVAKLSAPGKMSDADLEAVVKELDTAIAAGK